MSKPVRLADYLYEQVARLAAAEKRSTANMVQVLLEQALKMNGPIQPAGTVLSERGSSALSGEVASAKTRPAEPPRSESTDHFKPDFKKGKK